LPSLALRAGIYRRFGMLDRVTIVCFLASYGTALGLELLYQFRPREGVRWLALGFGAAGLLAQTIFLAVRRPPLIWQFGWMLFLAWILAIFYLIGSVHHRRLSWGLFVLPLVIGLVGLGAIFGLIDGDTARSEHLLPIQDAWGAIHAGLLLLAAVGLCVGFLASMMYLVQAHRLRSKVLPGQGLRLWSLERIEAMNRRAIVLAFPLLTAGMLLGGILMLQENVSGWSDPRLLASAVLWLTFALLVYLRYGYHLRGRQVALLTILTFALLVCCLALSHPVGQGGSR
jgi:ABC-type transport system involved in cytochrome c biogenesis permease subunit